MRLISDHIKHITLIISITFPAVSHILQFRDTTTSPAGDASSPAEDVDVKAGDAHL